MLWTAATGCHGPRSVSASPMENSAGSQTQARETYTQLQRAYKLLLRDKDDPRTSPAIRSALSQLYSEIPKQSVHDIDHLIEFVQRDEYNNDRLFEAVLLLLLMRDFQSKESMMVNPYFFGGTTQNLKKDPTFDEYARAIWNSDWRTLNMRCWSRHVYGLVPPPDAASTWRLWLRKSLTPRSH